MNQRLRVLQDLGAQVERLAAHAAPARPPARRRRVLATAVVLALLAAAAALAATGLLLTGAPVRPGLGDLTNPATGPGVVRPGSVTGILAQTPDPAGGPPWGIRVVGTTRGLACLQVGRVVRGQLGVLGQDGLFADDGRFHPLATAVTTPAPGCFAPDAAGHVFAAVDYAPLPASGYALRLTGPKAIGTPGGCADPGLTRTPPLPRCPAADERALDYGLLGPRAVRVTFAADGRSRTVPAGPGGAYLIVRGAPKRTGFTTGLTPPPGSDQPLRQVSYRGQASCAVAGGPPCAPAGYRPFRIPRPSQVAAPLHVAHGTSGARMARLSVTFTARVAVSDAGAAYLLVLERPAVGPCVAGGTLATATATDIPAGARVTLRIDGPALGPCPGGAYTGGVYYVHNAGDALLIPRPGHPPGAAVGRFAFTQP